MKSYIIPENQAKKYKDRFEMAKAQAQQKFSFPLSQNIENIEEKAELHEDAQNSKTGQNNNSESSLYFSDQRIQGLKEAQMKDFVG